MSKVKKLAYVLIDPGDDVGGPIYGLMRELVDAHHEHLRDARIALAWNRSWKADADGRVQLGLCRKASDLDRELAPFDFAIVLSEEFWTHANVTDLQRRALLDHELCHAGVATDSRGDIQIDQRGRKVYRIIKHDIEEFASIGRRYGCWKSDIEAFADALRESPQRTLDLERAASRILTEAASEHGMTVSITPSVMRLVAGGRS